MASHPDLPGVPSPSAADHGGRCPAPQNVSAEQNAPLDLLLIDASGYGYLPPLGLLYLASYVEPAGFRTRVHVMQGKRGGLSRAALRALLERHRPAVVGLSVTAESIVDIARHCARIRDYSNAKIVLGGPEATADPWGVMDRTGADGLVMGDGEASLWKLLHAWREGGVPDDLRGLLVRTGEEIAYDDSRPPVLDLDRLPFPDFSHMLNEDSGVRTMVTGRGCPFRCTFCFEGRSHTYRMRNLDNVLAELRQLLTGPKVKVFAFLDDTFTLDKDRARALCKTMKELYNGPWFCEGRIGVLHRHPEIIDLLAEAGLTRLQLGLESGSQKVLNAYRKGTTPEQIRAVFRHCHEAGIASVIGNFIVGGAFEDNDTFRETVQMAKDLIDLGPGSTELTTCYLYPYTGTAIQEDPAKYALEFVEDLPLYNAAGRTVCMNATEQLSRGELSQYRTVLQQTIDQHMQEKVDDLPPERIEVHLRNARDSNIQSEWFLVFLRCQPLALYVRMLIELRGSSWLELAAKESWLQYCPIRAAAPAGSRNGDLTVLARNSKAVQLSGLDRHLYELSSGKLSLEDMLPYLRKHAATANTGDESLVAQLRQSCERLGRDFLLLYREL